MQWVDYRLRSAPAPSPSPCPEPEPRTSAVEIETRLSPVGVVSRDTESLVSVADDTRHRRMTPDHGLISACKWAVSGAAIAVFDSLSDSQDS